MNRRTYLTTTGAVLGGTAVAGCAALMNDDGPTIDLANSTLIDRSLSPTVASLEPGEMIELRASARIDETVWESSATFEADENGRVEPATQKPVAGDYDWLDPMGLFWALAPDSLVSDLDLPLNDPFEVTLTAMVDQEVVAEATTERLPAHPDITVQDVNTEPVVGKLFTPPDNDSAPGIVLLHGNDGVLPVGEAQVLASRGYAVLTPRYWARPFEVEHDALPETPVEIPVKVVERAIDWLLNRPGVVSDGVGLKGVSLGGVLALLTATRVERIDVVISDVGSTVIFEASNPDSVRQFEGRSPFMVEGTPVPFIEMPDDPPEQSPRALYSEALADADEETIAAAMVPVERIEIPILMYAGEADRTWPSARLHEIGADRLTEHNQTHYEHIVYENVGHYVPQPPHLPIVGMGVADAEGVSAAGLATASTDSWSRIRDLFNEMFPAAE